jgi:hypothetical protein
LNDSAEHVTYAFLKKTSDISDNLKINPDDLMAVMAFESNIDPGMGGKSSSAVGLIEFMPPAASQLGTTSEALLKMSAVEQLDYVYEFLKPYTGRMKNSGDIYMAVLWPSGLGKEDTHVLWNKNDYRYKTNKGLDVNNDGTITRGEAVQKVIERRDAYEKF